jgi:hypothetical protein
MEQQTSVTRNSISDPFDDGSMHADVRIRSISSDCLLLFVFD